MTPIISTAEWLLRIYLAQVEAWEATGCKVCARLAEQYRAELAALAAAHGASEPRPTTGSAKEGHDALIR